LSQASPIADDLERHINQLVNKAEADMVAEIDQNQKAFVTSRWIVIGFALGSILLALILGYAITWSLLLPVRKMGTRLREIAAGDFTKHVEVMNRDELGTLARSLNGMNDELGHLYDEQRSRNRELTAALHENVRLVQEL